jgi:hypothetical protein
MNKEKEEKLHPRLQAKLKDLQLRGLLNKVHAYIPPQEIVKK